MWQSAENLIKELWLPAEYVFLVERNSTLQLKDESDEFGDIYFIDKLPSYNVTQVR